MKVRAWRVGSRGAVRARRERGRMIRGWVWVLKIKWWCLFLRKGQAGGTSDWSESAR